MNIFLFNIFIVFFYFNQITKLALEKFLFKIFAKGLNELIFYKKIEADHVMMNKSYIFLGFFIIETEVTMEEPFCTNEENTIRELRENNVE